MWSSSPGARRPETARSAARAAGLELTERDRAALSEAFVGTRTRKRVRAGGDVVVVMGIPGAGKSRLAQDFVERGYERLNRDERGGSLRELAGELDALLAAGPRPLVLDNTYLTRAARSYAIDAARRQGAGIRCVWLDTPLAEAQVNLVERLLDVFGRLLAPEELKRREPGLLMPTSQMRAVRELEPPSVDEGFAAVERVAFERAPGGGRPGVFVAAPALAEPGWREALAEPDAPHLVYDWRPDGTVEDVAIEELAAAIRGPVERAVCPHGAGPPSCWCRPPLPGLPLAFARAHGIELRGSVLIGSRPAHRTLAAALGARYVAV
jgi:predicted kinase